jgi:uncharacterized protein YpuA (DUF1002 family)
MTLSDWKPIIDGTTAVLSLAAAIAGLVAAFKSHSAQQAVTRIEHNVNELRNELNVHVTSTQTLQVANAPRIENNLNVTFNAGAVMEGLRPLDVEQMRRTQELPPRQEGQPGE